MIAIINDETKAKKYIDAVKRAFDIYKLSNEMDVKDTFRSKNMKTIIKKITKNCDKYATEFQAVIIKDNILGNRNIMDIAAEYGYSVSYAYEIRSKIYKDFATVLFEVLIV